MLIVIVFIVVIVENTHQTFLADWSGEKSPYKFEKKIGEGATSHVYKATEKHTKKTVAIKVLQLRGGYAKSEFQIMQDLMQSRHPSIVRLFRIHEGERSKQLFFVMEYCDQGDLFQFLKKNGPISEDQTRELMGVSFSLPFSFLFFPKTLLLFPSSSLS